MPSSARRTQSIRLTGKIATAYLRHTVTSPDDLQRLIETIHGAVAACGQQQALPQPDRKPAVPIEQSVKDSYIVCLEDGGRFKSLKRHLRAKYDLSPDAYRERWGLTHDYPMVAPAYSRLRSINSLKMIAARKRRAALRVATQAETSAELVLQP